MNVYFVFVLEALLAFLITFFFLRKYIPLAKSKGLVGIDVHKPDKPKIPEMGGFGIVFGFLFGIAIAYPFISQSTRLTLLVAVTSVILAAFVGAFDDLINLSIIKKIILIAIASIPLIITKAGESTIAVPFYGQINLLFLYSLIFVPLYFLIVTNATNMLAGYNGLEAGMAIITLSSLSIIALIEHNAIILYIVLPFLGALIAFYLFNKYPAKVFIGDVGTLSIGATLACAAIIGKAQISVLLLMIIYLIHFALYAIYTFIVFQRYGDPKISSCDTKEILTPMYFDKEKKKKCWHKLYFLLEHWFYPLTESKLVSILVTAQIILNAIVILLIFI